MKPGEKVGLTLPVEVATEVRAIIHQGYAPADLVMVAYEHHRADLLSEYQQRTTRQLKRRRIGRSPLTVILSAAERHALDALARILDANRSNTVTALLEHYFART